MQAAFMAQRFQVAGRLVTVDAIGGGNVNETYQAIFRTVYSEERFFLVHLHQFLSMPLIRFRLSACANDRLSGWCSQ